jgi:hypothetical protein
MANGSRMTFGVADKPANCCPPRAPMPVSFFRAVSDPPAQPAAAITVRPTATLRSLSPFAGAASGSAVGLGAGALIGNYFHTAGKGHLPIAYATDPANA